MAPSVKFVPRSLMTPGGAVFLDPAHRVTRDELNRRDARWRALRERAYARAWSDDATLVDSSVHYYAASVLRDFEERTLGRSSNSRRLVSGGGGGAAFSDESSSIRNQRSFRDGASVRRSNTMETNHHVGRFTRIFKASRQSRRFGIRLRRLIGVR